MKYFERYRYNTIKLFLLIFFGFSLNHFDANAFKNENSDQPNVILIVADDMGVGDLSAFNEGLSETPKLDKLIDESVYFKQAYASSSVCAPSRASLLTGKYPHRTGSVTLNMQSYPELTRISLDQVTMGNIFSDNGYITGLIGKWHNGIGKDYHPLQRGFQEVEGFMGFDVADSYYEYRLDIQGNYQDVTDKYLTEDLSERAINFVRRHQNNPFFLLLAHYAPHRPLSAPEELIQNYVDQGLDENTATIYAMIEVMDKGIGELVTELERLGIDDETIIIFTSDNGPDPLTGERFNVDLRGAKYEVYEGGIHIPFLVNWPGTLTPGVRETMIHFTDVLPTLVEICNLDVSHTLISKWDGRSFGGLLFDKNADLNLPEHRFWQWNRGVPMYSHNAAMREGDWKLVRPYVTMRVPDAESTALPKLYNIADDPSETTDLSEEYPRRYERMRVLLRQWSREMERDRLKIEN